MRNLNLHVHVPRDRRVMLQLPEDVEPGDLEITVIVRSPRRPVERDSLLSRLPDLRIDKWPEGMTFSRSELYGDDGR